MVHVRAYGHANIYGVASISVLVHMGKGADTTKQDFDQICSRASPGCFCLHRVHIK